MDNYEQEIIYDKYTSNIRANQDAYAKHPDYKEPIIADVVF